MRSLAMSEKIEEVLVIEAGSYTVLVLMKEMCERRRETIAQVCRICRAKGECERRREAITQNDEEAEQSASANGNNEVIAQFE